jgi:hypothetical protein
MVLGRMKFSQNKQIQKYKTIFTNFNIFNIFMKSKLFKASAELALNLKLSAIHSKSILQIQIRIR